MIFQQQKVTLSPNKRSESVLTDAGARSYDNGIKVIMRTPERVIIMASAKNARGKLTLVAVKMESEGKKRLNSDVNLTFTIVIEITSFTRQKITGSNNNLLK